MIKLEEVNFKYKNEDVSENNNFYGKKFVITGTLENYKRDELAQIIENIGGESVKSVSKNTDVVIVGENPGTKYDKAQELQIEVWDEEKLLKMLK